MSHKAEGVFGQLHLLNFPLNGMIWNILIHAYTKNGQYEQANAVFDQVFRGGLSPTIDTINGLMQSLVN